MRDGKPQLLQQFAFDRGSRMLAWLNMPTGGKPELRVFVIDQKIVLVINHHDIVDQMFRRGSWFLKAAKLCA